MMLDPDDLVAPGDADAMAARIVALVSDPVALAEAQSAARRRAERFRWEEIAASTASRVRAAARSPPSGVGAMSRDEPKREGLARDCRSAGRAVRPPNLGRRNGARGSRSWHTGSTTTAAWSAHLPSWSDARTHGSTSPSSRPSSLPTCGALVDWRPTRVPARPIPAAAPHVLRPSLAAPSRGRSVELVHSLGAIAPNHADVVTVQYCHAGSLAKTGRLAPRGATRTSDAEPRRREGDGDRRGAVLLSAGKGAALRQRLGRCRARARSSTIRASRSRSRRTASIWTGSAPIPNAATTLRRCRARRRRPRVSVRRAETGTVRGSASRSKR